MKAPQHVMGSTAGRCSGCATQAEAGAQHVITQAVAPLSRPSVLWAPLSRPAKHSCMGLQVGKGAPQKEGPRRRSPRAECFPTHVLHLSAEDEAVVSRYARHTLPCLGPGHALLTCWGAGALLLAAEEVASISSHVHPAVLCWVLTPGLSVGPVSMLCCPRKLAPGSRVGDRHQQACPAGRSTLAGWGPGGGISEGMQTALRLQSAHPHQRSLTPADPAAGCWLCLRRRQLPKLQQLQHLGR